MPRFTVETGNLDETRERVLELKVTTLCASKPVGGSGRSKEEALTKDEHIAFVAVYRFSDFDGVQPFDVPPDAARVLR